MTKDEALKLINRGLNQDEFRETFRTKDSSSVNIVRMAVSGLLLAEPIFTQVSSSELIAGVLKNALDLAVTSGFNLDELIEDIRIYYMYSQESFNAQKEAIADQLVSRLDNRHLRKDINVESIPMDPNAKVH
jgi:hypothetical protein